MSNLTPPIYCARCKRELTLFPHGIQQPLTPPRPINFTIYKYSARCCHIIFKIFMTHDSIIKISSYED